MKEAYQEAVKGMFEVEVRADEKKGKKARTEVIEVEVTGTEMIKEVEAKIEIEVKGIEMIEVEARVTEIIMTEMKADFIEMTERKEKVTPEMVTETTMTDLAQAPVTENGKETAEAEATIKMETVAVAEDFQ